MRIDSNGQLGLGITPNDWFTGFKVFQFPTGSIFTFGEALYMSQGFQVNSAGYIGSTNVPGAGAGGTTNDVAYYTLTDGQHTWFTSVNLAVPGARMFLTNTGALVLNNNSFFDYKGETRAAPINTKTAAYNAVLYDAGQTIYTNSGVTISASIFTAGDMLTIVNSSASAITITANTSVTFRLAGTVTTGNRTLAQYGIATFLCVIGGATPTYHCSGAGLT
jgi:hypothetical protein